MKTVNSINYSSQSQFSPQDGIEKLRDKKKPKRMYGLNFFWIPSSIGLAKDFQKGAYFFSKTLIKETAHFIYMVTTYFFQKTDLYHLEKNLKLKFKAEIIDRLKNLKQINTIYLFKSLLICKEEEQEIITNLFEKFDLSDTQAKEILMGAHVRLEDDGVHFDEWIKKIPKKNKTERLSSHPSHATQYAVRGPLVKEFLFSKIEHKGKIYTWFQLENHPLSMGHAIRHFLDYIKYRISGKQQGPYGSSYATHHHPILIKLKKCVADPAPL